MKNMQTMPLAYTDAGNNFLFAKIRTRLKKIMIPKGKSKKVVGEVICTTAQSKTLQKKYLWQLDVKVQWNNLKKHV